MGTTIRSLSEAVSYIASDDTWIEGKAIQQLQTTAALAHMQRVVGMPDLHPGRGYPVGAAFFSTRVFYPALVGNDIGCGMALWQTDIPLAKLNIEKLEKRLGNIDLPPEPEWIEEHLGSLPPFATEFSMGTIGGGNHFAELQQVETIYDGELSSEHELSKKHLVLLVHSGSRGLGQQILAQHVQEFGHQGLYENTPEAVAYLEKHHQALQFAANNRCLIAGRILSRLRADGEKLLDVHHNLVSPAFIEGKQGWLHRKGATPSDQGWVVIPGSRGDFSYLVEPLPSAKSLYSLAHGAGRKWMRSECKDRLCGRYTLAQLSRTALGSRVICEDKQLMFQEAPEAYKSIETVIGSMDQAGLVRVVARLKPVLTYKTRGGAE